MRITFQYRTYLLATVVAGSVLFGSCKKDKVPISEPTELTKWEKIAGNYKVFDTLGIYLYDMSISHSHNFSNNTDSLYFENLDDNFDFSSLQLNFGSGVSEYFITIGPQDTIYDNANNRWKLLAIADVNFNTLINDTIKMKYRITNINYYLSDLVPYCDTTKIQIAVKQH